MEASQGDFDMDAMGPPCNRNLRLAALPRQHLGA